MNTHISIQQATPSDAHDLAAAALSAFQDDAFSRDCMGWPWPASHSWEHYDEDLAYEESHMEATLHETRTVVLKATDKTSGSIVGFTVWSKMKQGGDTYKASSYTARQVPLPAWADGALIERCNRELDVFAGKFIYWNGDRAFIRMLGVRPSHRRQGIAQKLLQAGLDLTDAVGQDVYVEASPMGRGIYERLGFEQLETIKVVGRYEETAMLRKAAPPKVTSSL